MIQTQTVHINFTGGIVSPGYLKDILEIASTAKVSNARFGLRQQLILDVPIKHFALFETTCKDRGISYYRKKDALPNIVSSYPAAGIFTTDSWLREGVYKDVFNLFTYTPTLKINICDSNQSFVPFFTGHINWISSASTHFWHLYIRLPKTQKVYCFPELVYTNDLPLLSEKIEGILLKQETIDGKQLSDRLKATTSYVSKPIEKDLKLPSFSLPYYEGFNKYDNNYWLGIYRREETFPISFLIDVCAICLETKIGQLYTTAWKSIIIKGIEMHERSLWDYVLGKYRINVRHAANELNWQVEDNIEDGLLLKRHVIRYFDKEDVRTYGLSFAVQTRPHSGMFGSIIIRKQEVKNLSKLKSLDRFEILYTKDFNPNSFDFISFRQYVEKEYLGTYLVSLCKYFYEERSAVKSAKPAVAPVSTAVQTISQKTIHQCKHCLTVYDFELGDDANNIAVGTEFNNLPDNYQCPLCEAGKEDFIEVSNALELTS
jgi:rubredoxin